MKSKVLLVDDDKLVHKIVTKELCEDHELHQAYSGEEGLEILETIVPDIILLDIEMPGINGYQVCEKIRNETKYDEVLVVFLSGNSDQRQIMLAYELGADDYISKPFSPHVLRQKLLVLEKHHTDLITTKSQLEQAQQMAFESMKSSSELGQVMMFIEQSYGINHFSTLAENFFQLTQSWGLNCSVLIDSGEGTEFYSCDGSEKPMEQQLLQSSHDKGRFIDFGCRTIINYSKISVLIKNMPLDQAETYGRYKDLMPPVMGAIDAKIHSLIERNQVIQQSQKLTDSFSEIKESLIRLASTLNNNHQRAIALLGHLYGELMDQLPRLGLESDQEEAILDLAQHTLDKISKETMDTDGTNRELASVIIKMKKLVDEQNSIVEEIRKDNQRLQGALVTAPVMEENAYNMDVELF